MLALPEQYGVRATLVTKTLQERPAGQQSTSAEIESILKRWGITVLHRAFSKYVIDSSEKRRF